MLVITTLEQDADVRTDLLVQAEAVMMEDMPVIPLYYYTNLYVIQDHVENMSPDALGNINLKDVSISSGE